MLWMGTLYIAICGWVEYWRVYLWDRLADPYCCIKGLNEVTQFKIHLTVQFFNVLHCKGSVELPVSISHQRLKKFFSNKMLPQDLFNPQEGRYWAVTLLTFAIGAKLLMNYSMILNMNIFYITLQQHIEYKATTMK